MTKRSVLGLKTSVSYKLMYFATNGLKSSAPCAKMAKRSDLGLKTSVSYKLVHFAKNVKSWCNQRENYKALFCTNLCTLLKSAKKLYAQCQNEKTCCSWAENAVCTNSCTLLKVAKKWCPGEKMTKHADHGLKTLFVQTRALC